MSFFTSLDFYRPTTPPLVTGASLAGFLRSFGSLQVSETSGQLSARVKFGSAIDEDEMPSVWQDPVDEWVSVSQELDWDLEIQPKSLNALAATLERHKNTIYRAHIRIGPVTDEIYSALRRIPSPENETGLDLDEWGLEIGPIMSASLGSAEEVFVGWMSVNLSGYGYLYPWTFAESVRRAESHPAVQQVMELCRRTWPVEAERPDRRQQNLRRQMGELWPYSATDLPWDWYWGLSETG